MATGIDLGCDIETRPAGASPRGQSPGFQRVRIGQLLITALYDGFVPVLADDLHGAPPTKIRRLLTDGFLPADGDRHTAVTAFLVEDHDRQILIDTGSGHSLGPDTGYVLGNLVAAGIDPGDIDHVLLTHLHPDHAGGLISADGRALFSHATIHAAKAEADHWLDPDRAAAATGVQHLVHDTAARAVVPYRHTGRFVTFDDCGEVIPGARPVNLAGHTPGHTGYLFGEGNATVLFWGDTVHCHTVQLRCPSVTMASDSDELAAIAARRKASQLVSSNRWWVGAAHLPFPGLGHLRRNAYGYTWLPGTYKPVQ